MKLPLVLLIHCNRKLHYQKDLQDTDEFAIKKFMDNLCIKMIIENIKKLFKNAQSDSDKQILNLNAKKTNGFWYIPSKVQ